MTAAERNLKLFEGRFGAVYARYMESERVARLVSRVVWGSDVRPYYRSMGAIAEVHDDGTVIDAPCGAGPSFRGIDPSRRIRYLGFDLSPRMVARARRRAEERGLTQVEVAVADATELPVRAETANLFLSHFGLHCLDDPAAALREAARALAHDGRLVGSTIVRGDRLLDRIRVAPGRGGFGRVGTAAELREWIAAAGFREIELDTHGIFAMFRAVSD